MTQDCCDALKPTGNRQDRTAPGTLSVERHHRRAKLGFALAAAAALLWAMAHLASAKADPSHEHMASAESGDTHLQSGTYNLDPKHTAIIFGVKHLGISIFHGTFDTSEGTLAFDADNPQDSALSVKVKAASVDTNTEKLNTELTGSKMFDAANHPDVTFVSTEISQTEDKKGTIKGNLTIKGITKPVTLEAQLDGSGIYPMMGVPAMGFSARTKIKRSDFGLDEWTGLVGDDVAIYIYTEFLKTE